VRWKKSKKAKRRMERASHCDVRPENWAGLTPEDFDGHTAFHSMTAEQRLNWLSEIARFLHELSSMRR
jgi:hypothetical protein